MLRKGLLLICAFTLLAPVGLLFAGDSGDEHSDTKRSISVVIRHCTS